MTDHVNSEHAHLEINARAYRFDPILDPIADMIEQGPSAWKDVPARLLGQASIHKDFRDNYRRAVAAGAIPDNRNPETHEEN